MTGLAIYTSETEMLQAISDTAAERDRLREINAGLLEALTAEAESCPDCDGTGTACLMADETDVGCPPGSSGVDCGGCALSRAAIAKATGGTA